MSREVLLYIGGAPVYVEEDESVSRVGEMTIDADGSPRAYGPEGCCPEPLDYLANAGYEGNWWGIVTDSYGQPFVQKVGDLLVWPYPGLYLSTTDYLVPNFGKYDARHYLDSEHVLFMVVPDKVRMTVAPRCSAAAAWSPTSRPAGAVNASSATSARAIIWARALSRSPPILGSPDVPRPAARVIVSAGTIKCGPVKPPRDSRCSSPGKGSLETVNAGAIPKSTEIHGSVKNGPRFHREPHGCATDSAAAGVPGSEWPRQFAAFIKSAANIG
jgi:hypothetical protein